MYKVIHFLRKNSPNSSHAGYSAFNITRNIETSTRAIILVSLLKCVNKQLIIRSQNIFSFFFFNSTPEIPCENKQEVRLIEIQPSTSTKPSSERESEDSDEIESECVEEKPIWRPKQKKKRKRSSRQGW